MHISSRICAASRGPQTRCVMPNPPPLPGCLPLRSRPSSSPDHLPRVLQASLEQFRKILSPTLIGPSRKTGPRPCCRTLTDSTKMAIPLVRFSLSSPYPIGKSHTGRSTWTAKPNVYGCSRVVLACDSGRLIIDVYSTGR